MYLLNQKRIASVMRKLGKRNKLQTYIAQRLTPFIVWLRHPSMDKAIHVAITPAVRNFDFLR